MVILQMSNQTNNMQSIRSHYRPLANGRLWVVRPRTTTSPAPSSTFHSFTPWVMRSTGAGEAELLS